MFHQLWSEWTLVLMWLISHASSVVCPAPVSKCKPNEDFALYRCPWFPYSAPWFEGHFAQEIGLTSWSRKVLSRALHFPNMVDLVNEIIEAAYYIYLSTKSRKMPYLYWRSVTGSCRSEISSSSCCFRSRGTIIGHENHPSYLDLFMTYTFTCSFFDHIKTTEIDKWFNWSSRLQPWFTRICDRSGFIR
jgi:hypothetical protein